MEINGAPANLVEGCSRLTKERARIDFRFARNDAYNFERDLRCMPRYARINTFPRPGRVCVSGLRGRATKPSKKGAFLKINRRKNSAGHRTQQVRSSGFVSHKGGKKVRTKTLKCHRNSFAVDKNKKTKRNKTGYGKAQCDSTATAKYRSRLFSYRKGTRKTWKL